MLTEQESDVLHEAIATLSLPSVGRLVETGNGVYENFIGEQIQWVVTFDADNLVDLKLAKHGFAVTNQGCWRSILDLLRTSVGLFRTRIVWAAERGRVANSPRRGGRIRAKVAEWEQDRGLPVDNFRVQRGKS